jgi:hypothetical protein
MGGLKGCCGTEGSRVGRGLERCKGSGVGVRGLARGRQRGARVEGLGFRVEVRGREVQGLVIQEECVSTN